MPLQFKRAHYAAAWLAFFVAFFTYLLTMQPTIPFWDCGEFAAAASALQIPHPPGAPLWTMVGRMAMLLPTFSDPAARYNLFSVLSSAVSIALLYLTLVRLISIFRGAPERTSNAIITLGGAFIGALAYCWTDSFWFNALECEVYAFGSLFISLVPWLMLVWHEHADEEGNERYLLLIAYVIGLSLGVHQLALLTMFPVFMIVYYRRRDDAPLGSWLKMVGLSVIAFAITFVIILSDLVSWAAAGKGVLSIIALAAIVGSVIYGHVKKRSIVALSGWALLMVFFGYTTYMLVMVRADQDPPMNENAPRTFASLSGYINRDQYGSVSLTDEIIHRRLPQQKAEHAATWDNYSSDWDFFWTYQTNFMFHRYLAWNFIGRDGDFQGAGVDGLKTLALPFILGLFGIFYHFKRDPKRALTLLGAFIIMGYLVDWYQNQQDPQPRERDYFYVGAFYIYAMWIGIGAVGVMEFIRERYAALDEKKLTRALVGAMVGLLILGPINQCVGLTGMALGQPFSKSSKWAEYSRKHNWIPWEYAYNILQSCEKDAILFTYGDNDTFPLWCIQDAYGIRRDVRIVQLQLATMMWNVKQIKYDNDWGAKGIKLTTFTDELIKQPDNDVYRTLDWNPAPIGLHVSAETARWITGDPKADSTTFNWTPRFGMPSDQVVLDIIRNNIADRPIYYSVTVPESDRAGINNYLVFEGLAGRVTPFAQPADNTGIGGSINTARYASMVLDAAPVAHPEPHRGMILNSYRDPEANRSYMDDQYSSTFRSAFVRLAYWSATHNDQATTRRSLDTMEARIPLAKIEMDPSFANFISDLADKAGDWPLMKQYAAYGADQMAKQIESGEMKEQGGGPDPQYQLANLEMRAGRFASARKRFQSLLAASRPDRDGFYKLKIEEVDARELEAAGKFAESAPKFSAIIHTYAPTGPGADLQDLHNRLNYDSAHIK